MLETHELVRNGPYLRITLPDVLPPDWDALEGDLDLELDEGVVEKATLVAPRCAPPGPTVDAVLRVASFFGRQGVRVWIESPEGSGPGKDVSASRQGVFDAYADLGVDHLILEVGPRTVSSIGWLAEARQTSTDAEVGSAVGTEGLEHPTYAL